MSIVLPQIDELAAAGGSTEALTTSKVMGQAMVQESDMGAKNEKQ